MSSSLNVLLSVLLPKAPQRPVELLRIETSDRPATVQPVTMDRAPARPSRHRYGTDLAKL